MHGAQIKNGHNLARSAQDIYAFGVFCYLHCMFPLRVFHFKIHTDHKRWKVRQSWQVPVPGFLSKLELMMILSRETFPLNQFHRNLLSIKNGRGENITKFFFTEIVYRSLKFVLFFVKQLHLTSLAAFNELQLVNKISSLCFSITWGQGINQKVCEGLTKTECLT